ncbi:hypothetical protein LLS1_35380 [Leifsonia sp. LS1]|nr:hypothetical protein LLS1_35380 [Leifsonia sp. LS1]
MTTPSAKQPEPAPQVSRAWRNVRWGAALGLLLVFAIFSTIGYRECTIESTLDVDGKHSVVTTCAPFVSRQREFTRRPTNRGAATMARLLRSDRSRNLLEAES